MRDQRDFESASAQLERRGASAPVLRDIQESWERSVLAGVSPGLASAPLVFKEDALAFARETSDWCGLAESVLTPHGKQLLTNFLAAD